MPRVSIGLPVYNGENYLEEALQLLSIQTFEDFELIISDNGSTDRTQEICQDFASQDNRIRYYRSEENRGAAWNYNHVFELATCEFFRWASHDDLCAPIYIEQCMKVLEHNPDIVLCYPRTIIIDESGNPLKRYYDQLHLDSQRPEERLKHYFDRAEGRMCNAVFGIMRSSLLAQTPLIGSYVASDQVLLAWLALLGRFHEIPEELFFRRDHAKMSARANLGDDKKITLWFDPKHKKKLVFVRWQKFCQYLKCACMAGQLDIPARVKSILYVLRWGWWHRPEIQKELTHNLKYFLFSRSTHRM